MKGVRDIRLRIECERHPGNHAKILPLANFFRAPGEGAGWQPLDNQEAELVLKRYFAERLGEIICGTSDMYIYPPGNRSPIGRCAACGAKLQFEVQELDDEGNEGTGV